MKLGMTITIADIKNLSKEGPCKINSLDFIIFMTSDEKKQRIETS